MPTHPHLTGDALANAVRQAARCRATRSHRMELIPGDLGRRPSFGALLTYRCELCGTVRFDIVQRRTGEVLYREYDHPDWYLAANETREAPSWWRAKWWESLDPALFVEAEPSTRKRPSARIKPRRLRAVG